MKVSQMLLTILGFSVGCFVFQYFVDPPSYFVAFERSFFMSMAVIIVFIQEQTIWKK